MFHAHLSCGSPNLSLILAWLPGDSRKPAYGPSLTRRLLDSDGFVSGWQPGNGISQSAVVCSSLPSTTFGDAHHNGRDRKPVESGLSEAHSPHVVADQVRHAQSGIR